MRNYYELSLEWWHRFWGQKDSRYAKYVWGCLERDVLPCIGEMSAQELTPPQVMAALQQVINRGASEAAYKTKSYTNQIFTYGQACGHCTANPTAYLGAMLPPRPDGMRPAIIDPAEAGQLMRDIYAYNRSPMVLCALKLAALTLVRSAELRTSEWKEIDFSRAEWRIPAAKMKMKRPHVVPLSKQALAVLLDLKVLKMGGRFLFPSEVSKTGHIGGGVLNYALHSMGYSGDTMTLHGFRAMASTILNEAGKIKPDVIEYQLAHVQKDKVRAAYNRTDYRKERVQMMQEWANTLDDLRGKEVVATHEMLTPTEQGRLMT